MCKPAGRPAVSANKSTSAVKGKSAHISLSVILIACAVVFKFGPSADLLNGFSSDRIVPNWQLQVAVTGFCLSPLVSKVRSSVNWRTQKAFGQDSNGGHVNEGEYEQASIYSILYSMYSILGDTLKETSNGTAYEFTFNTWGVAPSDFGDKDPQRYGKTSYSYFSRSPELRDYVDKAKGAVQIVEIGCGTGAGASHLSTQIFPNSSYMAIDMQAAAIDTCKRLHASDRLECVHVPAGVGPGNGGGSVPLPDSSVDIVVILETHIAENEISLREKAIFGEVSRILKPGGFFLWGNAIPTYVWHDAEKYLAGVGFKMVTRWNNTQGAVQARDEDAPRVDAMMQSVSELGLAFQLPYFGEPCQEVIELLIRNFYRDPGTNMYNVMVEGYHSYMHYVFQRGA